MANYDTKLGEWFKQVEKRAEELLARKRATQIPQEAQDTVEGSPGAPPIERSPGNSVAGREVSPIERSPGNSVAGREVSPRVVSAEMIEPAPRADAAALAAVEPRRVVADTSVIERPESQAGGQVAVAQEEDRGPALFEDAEIPPVEDFFSFLSRSGEPEQPAFPEPPLLSGEGRGEVPKDQGTLSLSEGTGIPRPVTVAREAAVERPTPVIQPRPVPHPAQAPPKPTVEVMEPIAEVAPAQPPAHESALDEKWERIPRHLRILFDGDVDEVAQHSYKSFKESRGSLIERLLDPTISLEDAARLLNVCPTTVRRYTNRGVLKHHRTAGNQRRFRLSDVLAFMESKQ